MPNGQTDPSLIARCELISRLCSLLAVILGLVVLAGWAFDFETLKHLRPGWHEMAPNTALAFVLAGVALFAAIRKSRVALFHGVHFGAAWLLALLAALSLFDYLAAVETGINSIFLDNVHVHEGQRIEVRTAFATGAAFLLTALALLWIDAPHVRSASYGATVTSMLVGVLTVMGYAFGASTLYSLGPHSVVALHTGLGLVVINVGILHARPRRRPMAVLISRTAGGMMARRLFPLALTAPFVIGWLFVQGQERNLYGSELTVAVMSLTYVLLSAGLIWHTAEGLRQADQRRLAAEHDKRQQQSQLTGIINSAMDAIIMVDASHRIVLFNPAAEQMFGRRADEMLGMPLDALLPARYRQDHGDHLLGFQSGRPNRRRGGVGTVFGLRANGEEFPIESSIAHVEVDGECYLTAILRDVTESRKVLQALRDSDKRERRRSSDLATLLDAVPAAVYFALDPEGMQVTGNKLAYEWLLAPEGANLSSRAPDGYRLGDEVRLMKDGLPLDPAEMPLFAATEFEVRDYEFQIVAEGRTRHVFGNATCLRDESGEVRGAISAFIDITARREAEMAMHAAMTLAERANEDKSRFLAAASHDLRQPLSALALYTNVLDEDVPPRVQPVVANMKACVTSLSALLTDLLDLSKLEAGVVKAAPSTFPVADLLASQVATRAPDAQLKGLRLHWVRTRLVAHTDPVLFKRILGNLIDNAIRYTECGGVVIGCRRRAGKTWIEVWDSGIGIPQDKQAEIFEEFKQLDENARTRGSGLGLAIVAKTAKLLGLEISVRSQPGRGSVFGVELPVTHESLLPAPELGDQGYRPLVVALVEDNTMVKEALARALERVGHRVIAAESGPELRNRVNGLRPDILVSDYRLAHGETGFDVISSLRRQLGTELPAVIVTGDTDPHLMRSMADRGIVVLHKPLDLETLQAYLEDLTHP